MRKGTPNKQGRVPPLSLASCDARRTAGTISSSECACWQPPGRLREWQLPRPGHSLNFFPAMNPSRASACAATWGDFV